ncbi:hypothetical protein [Variovorax sp. JS1663]|uniref:hypothetical protein n=1 Tax=Variovorax sp. JS1663 TaxID=1851577 RepID=UPI000B349DC0|nr:hypothetical protein [Variovorax sp. JS1663]OUM03749.1 hypothetical protein A8M77_04355 [Variovorax sp. JS1663]
MSAFDRSSGSRAFGSWIGAFKALADEAGVLLDALFSPGRIIDEVEEMRALHQRASRIEASDPQRAAVLRWHASRVGLR